MSSTPQPTEAKIKEGINLKEKGDEIMRNLSKGKGEIKDIKEALGNYHRALLYLLGINKQDLQSLGLSQPPSSVGDATKDPKQKEKTVDELIETVYVNMSSCYIQQRKWKKAVETADKALQKNENNYEAMLGKGKALGEQGFIEKASKVLNDVAAKSPENAKKARQELKHLELLDRQREIDYKRNQKRGFLKNGLGT